MTQLNVTGEHPARAGHPARAVVHAAGIETEYVRVGRGRAVVVIADDLDTAEIRNIIEVLQTRYTVLAAAPALHGQAGLSAWFSGFLEGLGITDAHLLLHTSQTSSLRSGELDHD